MIAHTYREKGKPLRIPTPGKNRRVAVQGAICWPNGPFRFSYGPRSVNTNVFLGILPQLAERVRKSGKRIVLVLDNGSAHTSKRSTAALNRLKDKIRVFWLPPYTSEQLNDIEPVWKHLKEDFFSRMLTQRPEEFTARVIELLSHFRRPGAIAQMTKPCHVVSVRKKLPLPA